ncbi:MAG: molybdopterin-dependent oxidoreductase [Nakamurella sp.]
MTTHETPPPTSSSAPGQPGTRQTNVWPAIGIGIAAVGLTLTAAELIAAVGAWLGAFNPASAPFSALGAAFISITPGWLKEFGIGLFGQSDKAALAVSMVVTFLIVGALIGVIGRINRMAAAGIGAALVVVTGIAVLSRPDVSGGDLTPTVLGGVAGIWFLMRALQPSDDVYAQIHAGSATARSTAASRTTYTMDRRKALRMSGTGAVLAIAAGGLSRLVPDVADIQANRAAVKLPPVGNGTSTPAPGELVAGQAPGTTSTGPSYAADSATSPSKTALSAAVDPPVPDLTPYITPNEHFYRIDTAFTVPRVTTDEWHLKVHGLVDEPFEITWAELLAMPQVERTVTLTCVSNEVGGDLAGNAVWQGVLVSDLLKRAKIQRGADCLFSTSVDNFSVATPLAAMTDSRDSLLAIGMNGSPLPVEHGFPARLVVPGLYGYVSATKWVEDLEVAKFAEVTGYWTDLGWSALGPIKTASRIDTPKYDVTLPAGVVPVAGVAWAQHRGIDAVQVQVDDGPWQEATLSGAVSADTWRQWVFQWDTKSASSGKHTLRCRAIDNTGAVQDPTPASPAPNGASGYHQVPVVLA